MSQSADRGPSLEGGIWAAVIIAALIVILRVFAKFKIKRFSIDDVLMIFAEVLAIVSTVFLTLSVKHGFGKKLGAPFTQDTSLVLKYIAIQIPIVTLSTTVARSAFIIYLLGVLGTNRAYKIALWMVLAIQLAGNIVSAVLPLSICRNVNILWDPTVKTSCGDDAAIIKFAYFSNTFNSATDLFLAIFPTVVFWNLKLKLRIKISLIVLLSLGVIAMIASIIKTTKLDQVPSITNLGATGAIELIRWGYVENAIIIITSSIPCIRPLIISSVRKISSGGFSGSYELSGPSSRRHIHPNKFGQSQEIERVEKSDSANNDSVERILAQSTHTSTTVGRPDSPTDTHNDEAGNSGITKQVDISVVSGQFNSRDSGSLV
ncbi:hypothetical protein N7478_000025 [Penicillium angulare]|uniref:uncharacterized protein n=1 Tax=Penicillium angulare TaxID=116970 RepID=UPI0025421063|nr:uncharacterized protein N7478_000025 [Penicillium angulare]KAJ5290774.1 hypothetical protein N7478_000025 [Penicillium angulare]